MLSIIAIILSTITIILMIIILIRFKQLFSTDGIIEKTKKQMNRMIMDVNNNANRDIELINETTKRTRALINEADKKMENFREAVNILRKLIAEAENITSNKKSFIYDQNLVSDNRNSKSVKKNNSYISPESSYVVKKDENQGSLFDDLETDENKSILKDEVMVTTDGAAYKEVPLIITRVFDDKPVNKISAKDLPDKVEKLFRSGMNVEEIAAELSCSISEVAFIIDML